ncbi:MAG: 16S rRNA (guanine(527)-N(7))-methyltransferase RsmG [Thermotogota bacterium]
MNNENSFVKVMEKYSLEFENDVKNKLIKYIDMLINYPVNLTAIKDIEEAYENHIVDVILPLKKYDFLKDINHLVDVGSGGGIPGIIWAVLYPNIKINLVESVGKKTKALEHFKNKLDLKNVFIHNSRIEDFGQKNRNKFDVATCRALARTDIALEYTIPLINKNGKVILFKGKNYEDEKVYEKRALELLNSNIEKTLDYAYLIDKEEKQRIIIVYNKNENNIKDYPRKNGIPTKKPLGEM